MWNGSKDRPQTNLRLDDAIPGRRTQVATNIAIDDQLLNRAKRAGGSGPRRKP